MGVFPGNMCPERRKNYGAGEKKKLEGAGSEPLPNAANYSDVPTELATLCIEKDIDIHIKTYIG